MLQASRLRLGEKYVSQLDEGYAWALALGCKSLSALEYALALALGCLSPWGAESAWLSVVVA